MGQCAVLRGCVRCGAHDLQLCDLCCVNRNHETGVRLTGAVLVEVLCYYSPIVSGQPLHSHLQQPGMEPLHFLFLVNGLPFTEAFFPWVLRFSGQQSLRLEEEAATFLLVGDGEWCHPQCHPMESWLWENQKCTLALIQSVYN